MPICRHESASTLGMAKRGILCILAISVFPAFADANLIFRVKNTSDRLLSYRIICLDHPVNRHHLILEGTLQPGLEDEFTSKHGKGIYRIQWCEVGPKQAECSKKDFFTLDSTTEVLVTYDDIVVRNGGGKI